MAKKATYEELERRVASLERRLEESIHSEQLFRDIFEKSSQPIVVAYEDGGFRIVNDAYCELTGYSRKELLEEVTWKSDLTPERWRTFEATQLERARGQKKPVRYEKEYRRKEGSIIPVELMVYPLCDYKGDVIYYYASVTDISRHKAAEQSLREAKQAAEAASLAKSEFLANMSHEIRTPMNSILGFTQILQGRVTDAKERHYLNIIYSSSTALLNLLNDILDLSKIEAGKVELVYKEVNLKTLVEEMCQLFTHKVKEKGLELLLEISPQLPPTLVLDAGRLREVLINLLSNAVKFTERGRVKLSVRFSYPADVNHSRGDLVLSVEDSGLGIPLDEQESVFQAFTQRRGQNISRYGGTGLGLAIAKRLVEMMKGEIALHSSPGEGACFEISLPGVEVVLQEKGELGDGEQSDLSLVNFAPATILIVDDLDFNRELLKLFLRGFNFTLLEAADGREMLTTARHNRPQLILLDMKMPDMDGYEAATIMKKIEEFKAIPIIAVTASALKSDEEQINTLCDAYLRKPIHKKDLIRTIMKFLPHTLRG